MSTTIARTDRAIRWFIDRVYNAASYLDARSGKTHSGVPIGSVGTGHDGDNLPPPSVRDEEQQRIAMTISWIYSNLSMLARDVSSAAISVNDIDTNEEIKNHPLTKLINRPSEHLTRSFLLQFTVAWLVLDGNAYWYLAPRRGDMNDLAEIWPIAANRMRAIPDEKQFIRHYVWKDDRGAWRPVDPRYVAHFMLPNPWNPTDGLAMLTALMLAGDVDRSTAKFQRDMYRKGRGIPHSVVSLTPEIGDIDFQRTEAKLKADFEEERRIAIVRAGEFHVDTVGISPHDLELIASRRFTMEEIDKVFWGIPIGRVAQDGTAAREARKQMLENGVRPFHLLLEEQITTQILRRFYDDRHVVKFDDVRQQDRALRVQEATIFWRTQTLNEARREQKLPPYENMDYPGIGELLVPWIMDPSFIVLRYGIGGQFGGLNIPGQADELRQLGDSAARLRESLNAENRQLQNPNMSPPSLPGQDAPERIAGNMVREAVKAELKRWRRVAAKRLEEDGDAAAYNFASDILPISMADDIRAHLLTARSREDVNRIFELHGPGRD